MLRFLAVCLLALAVVAHAADRLPVENARIEYLIAVIAALPDAQFIRNGKAYDNKAAVDHLREKLRLAGGRVRTAEDFIRFCASESSITGQPYQIRFADGHVLPSAEFLQEKLAEFDRQNAGWAPASSAAGRGQLADPDVAVADGAAVVLQR